MKDIEGYIALNYIKNSKHLRVFVMGKGMLVLMKGVQYTVVNRCDSDLLRIKKKLNI